MLPFLSFFSCCVGHAAVGVPFEAKLTLSRSWLTLVCDVYRLVLCEVALTAKPHLCPRQCDGIVPARVVFL